MMPSLSRQTMRTLLTTLWVILVGGVRIFAWDSLKGGFIDIRPLPRVPRLLALVGLTLVFIFIGSILFNDLIRQSGVLEPLPLSSSEGRGIFVPSTAVPIAFLTTLLAWSMMLTGALHVMGAVRWSIFFCFVFFGLSGLFVVMLQTFSALDSALALVAFCLTGIILLTLVLAFALAPRFKLPVAFEFTLMLGCVGGLYLVMLLLAVRASEGGSVDFVSGYLVPEVVTNPRYLIIPFLFLAGAGIIDFGISLTNWGARSAQRFGRDWVFVSLLLALLAYRWFDFALQLVRSGVSANQLSAWTGAVLAGSILIPLAIWRVRKPFEDRVPQKLVVGLILAFVVPPLVIVVLTIGGSVLLISATDPNALAQVDVRLSFLRALDQAFTQVRFLLLALVSAGIAVVAVRRKRFTVAAYALILAWTQFVWWFMTNGQPLQAWRYTYADLDPFILLALTAIALYWLARKRLTPERALKLLALAFFGWVLNFTDFLDNPLSLFFGFAGVLFTAFGIFWSVVTAGGKFANYDSQRFPRMNRIILYLGYALITVNLTHWFIVTHDVSEQVLNNDLTATGLRIFGLTAAYLVFVEGGRALLKQGS
jgi:hypothetical protein